MKINEDNTIFLTLEDLNSFKKIGEGTDGIVYQYSKDTLIKIYRKNIFEITNIQEIINKPDKIYNKETFKIKNYKDKMANYYKKDADEYIKLRSKDVIFEAIRRQKNIKRSNLPKGCVYIDRKFAGCILKKLYGIQIHKLTGINKRYKFKIIKNLLLDVSELLENNIYHRDLAKSLFNYDNFIDENGNEVITKGHSHILVNPFNLNTNLLDMEGYSTVYTDYYNEVLEKTCLYKICILLINFLYNIELDDTMIEDPDLIEFELIKAGANKDLASNLANNNFNSIEEMKKILRV